MMKKVTSCVLALLVASIFTVPVTCQQQTQTASDKHAQKIKKYVARLKRWASDDPVTVKLYDGTQVNGHISEVADDHFVVTGRKSGSSTSIEYSRVKDVSEGLGYKTKIGMVVGGAFLTFIVICAVTHGCRE